MSVVQNNRFQTLLSVKSQIPLIFGILNVTDDSFSDGGLYSDCEKAVSHALQMLACGAAVVDIGAESTRPGSAGRSAAEELAVLIPVVSELRRISPSCVISVDTRKSEVARAVLATGADVINDVSGMSDEDMIRVIAETGAGYVLMHTRGTPETMHDSENLRYADLISDINVFFTECIHRAESAGVKKEQIILDPGIGFAKNSEDNLKLVRHADSFRMHGCPLLYGVSRKTFLSEFSDGAAPAERDYATVGALAYLTMEQVRFVRVHNVSAARSAMRTFAACCGGKISCWI